MDSLKKVRHIFFDLDHTLWDFEANARKTINSLLNTYKDKIGRDLPFEHFYKVYSGINRRLWEQYRKNRIGKNTLRRLRFLRAFDRFGIAENDWMADFSDEYIDKCPRETQLIPHAREILGFLQQHYTLHILTNGFEETQSRKLEYAGIGQYFTHIITSQSAAAKKPDPKIFNFALNIAQITAEEAVLIGDNYETDIIGGLQSGLKVIYFNPGNNPNPLDVPEVNDLLQLKNMFQA